MLYLPVGGVIDWIGLRASVPTGFLILEGQTLEKTNYNNFFTALNITTDTYTLPDLSNYFVRYGKTDNQLLSKQTDTMRKITGSTLLRFDVIPNPESPKGAFAKSNTTIAYNGIVATATNSGTNTFSFDSF